MVRIIRSLLLGGAALSDNRNLVLSEITDMHVSRVRVTLELGLIIHSQ